MARVSARWTAVILVVACIGISYLFFSHMVVQVTGPAVVKAAPASLRSPAGAGSSGISYPVRFSESDVSGTQVVTIRARPDFIFPAFGGVLLGSDRGEWGGELVFRDRSGTLQRLVDQNVRGIVRMPSGIVVFTGLAHLGMSAGAIYSVSRRADGSVVATLIRQLRGAPGAIRWTTQGDLVFQEEILRERPWYGLFGGRTTRCMVLDRAGVVRKQWCAAVME